MGELAIPRFGSVRESDGDYDPVIVRIGKRFDVLVDGKPVSKVIAYNCDEGWIRRYVTDQFGKVRVFKVEDAPYPGRSFLREETLVGRVTVRWR